MGANLVWRLTCAAVIPGVLAAAGAWGQCEYAWLAGPGQGVPGVDGTVKASTIWDPDGVGPGAPVLAVGGSFITAAGEAAVQNVAAWDGVMWRAIGEADGQVSAMTVFNGDLVIGGTLHDASGSRKGVLRWNGQSWEAVGDTGWRITALTVHEGKLFAAGDLRAPFFVARWDGQQWQPLAPLEPARSVLQLASFHGELVAAGTFTSIDGVDANYIARWDGDAWRPLGAGLAGTVSALTVFEGELIAGGAFTGAGGLPASFIAAWNGVSWRPLGAGVPGHVTSLAVRGGSSLSLIAAGRFPDELSAASNGVAEWNGSDWTSIGSGMDSTIETLNVLHGDLVAGGMFLQADGRSAWRVARWDGTHWQPTLSAPGLDGAARAFASYQGQLFAGGDFTRAGAVEAHIARWDGTAWRDVGGGVNGGVFALTVHNGELIASGHFTMAGGTPARHFARWDGTMWRSLGFGLDGSAVDLIVYDGWLIAGGSFSETVGGNPLNGLALWNGFTWFPLGSGVTRNGLAGSAYALVEYEGDLIVGGFFDTAGSGPATNVARFDGALWHPMGEGLGGYVNTMAVFNGELFAGGSMNHVGVPDVVRWDGDSWVPVDGGGHSIRNMLVYNGELVVTGGVLGQIAAWNGASWRAFGTGLNRGATALGLHNGELVVGGSFTRAGDVVSAGWAHWGPATPPLCAVDLNCDQVINPADLLHYVQLWLAADIRAERTNDTPAAIDVFDLLSYLNEWFTGC